MQVSRLFAPHASLALLILAVVTGASAAMSATPPVATAPVERCSRATTSLPPEPVPTIPAGELTSAIRSIASTIRVGAVIIDRENDAELLNVNGALTFQSASLVKLMIAIDALSAAPASAELREDIVRMLSDSDDQIASRLWVSGGGAGIVRRWARELGLTATRPPPVPGQWGATSISPLDVVTIYEFILADLDPEHRELIVHALSSTPRHADDGFDQHFGIPRAFDGPWAIKQGWSNTATALGVHSTGLVGPGWRYIVVMLTESPLTVSMATGAQAVTAGLRALTPLA
ncbi:MAG: serine hydrolase [Haloechinothrix sp.]